METVHESWEAVAYCGELSSRGVERLLEAFQAVPYGLKAKLYDSLIADARWHPWIYNSILYSAYATYGDLAPGRCGGSARATRHPRGHRASCRSRQATGRDEAARSEEVDGRG